MLRFPFQRATCESITDLKSELVAPSRSNRTISFKLPSAPAWNAVPACRLRYPITPETFSSSGAVAAPVEVFLLPSSFLVRREGCPTSCPTSALPLFIVLISLVVHSSYEDSDPCPTSCPTSARKHACFGQLRHTATHLLEAQPGLFGDGQPGAIKLPDFDVNRSPLRRYFFRGRYSARSIAYRNRRPTAALACRGRCSCSRSLSPR